MSPVNELANRAAATAGNALSKNFGCKSEQKIEFSSVSSVDGFRDQDGIGATLGRTIIRK